LDLLLHSQSAPDETAAIVIEPVLGEGGYVPAPSGYLQEVRNLCDAHGILLILDEVQSGFGRTGKFFAYEHAKVTPDILVMAKGLGSGLPISAIGASKGLMSKWIPGTHGGTYGGGSVLAAAGANATIDVLLEEKLIENSAKLGDYLVSQLKLLQEKFPGIGEVRGLGLMVGVEFTDTEGKPDADRTTAVMNNCIAKNLLILNCGSYKNVIRWIPPLVVNQVELDSALKIFESALKGTNS
jgi:4-aminobutyrate aminotransferase-like enzyme